MTVADLLRSLRRRWPVVVVGLLVVAAAVLLAGRPTPLYTAQTEVLFVPPASTATSPYDDKDIDALVSFAASVERVVDGGPVLRLVSADAPLYGTGLRSATSVQLVNQGTQWASSFGRPVVSVEVVDPTEAGATARLADAVARVQAAATQLQDEQQVPSALRIKAEPTAATPPVAYVGTTTTGRAKGLVGFALAGLLATLAVLVELERRARRRLEPVPA